MASTEPVPVPDWIRPGKAVCVAGIGSDNSVHAHDRIARVTKTLIVLEGGRRYRLDSGLSVPYSAYGGTGIHSKCQRPARRSASLSAHLPTEEKQ